MNITRHITKYIIGVGFVNYKCHYHLNFLFFLYFEMGELRGSEP